MKPNSGRQVSKKFYQQQQELSFDFPVFKNWNDMIFGLDGVVISGNVCFDVSGLDLDFG